MFYFSILILLFLFFISFFGTYFYKIDPSLLVVNSILLPPSSAHLFGTDRLGRDLLARTIAGGEVSLTIGVLSAIIASFIGFIYGSMAGFFQGIFDKVFIFVVDIFLTFPTFFLLLTLVSYIEASSLILIFVISITGWMSTARLIRSESFKITNQSYIKILKIANVSQIKILFKYYTPLLAPIYLVSFTFGVGGAILAESGLSFLGLGIVAPQMSWGSIMSDGKDLLEIAWWVSFFPGLAIFLVTFSLINISNHLQSLINKKEIQY
jgi:peptide/nickel transport system permease protein